MFTTIIFVFALFVSFLDYCVLKVSAQEDRELSDKMQIEYLENYRKKHAGQTR